MNAGRWWGGPSCAARAREQRRSIRFSVHGRRAAARPAPGTRGRRRFGGRFRAPGAVRARAACPGMGLHPRLPVGAGAERPHHGCAALCAVPDPALARAARAGGRLSVHGAYRRRARADLSGPVRAGWSPGCRTADDGLALHVLARRLPARRHLLCARQEHAARSLAWGGGRHRGEHCGRPRRPPRRDADRHRRACGAASHHARQQLHAGHDRRRLLRMGLQRRGARRAVVAPPAFGARRLGSWW